MILADTTPAPNPGVWTILIPLVVAVGSGVYNLLQVWQAKRQILEGLSTELVKKRVDPYIAFMEQLRILSHQSFTDDLDRDTHRRRADDGTELFNKAIYGLIGVLASYETRETIVCARVRCVEYKASLANPLILPASGKSYEGMRTAVWALHQLLRSDLNLLQPGLAREIEKIHRKFDKTGFARVTEKISRKLLRIKGERPVKLEEAIQNEILDLHRRIPHLDWSTKPQHPSSGLPDCQVGQLSTGD